MSDVKQRKQRKRKEPRDEQAPAPKDEPSKEEYKIARWMRSNIPTKKTKFLSHTVEYFTACKAVDQLLESPWAKSSKTGEDPLFTTRESIVEYMDVMLRHKIFHRARKIIVPESELKSKKKKDKEKENKENTKDGKPAVEDSKKDEDKEKSRKDEAAITAAESSQAEGGTEGGDQSSSKVEKKKQKKEEGEKKKRKIRLDMHLDQRFVDGIDAYVWIYEPTPYYYYVIGFLVVIAVIAVCLFPLWPSSVRQGVYYLSLAAAGFLVFILALAVIRLVFFCLVWGLTFGRHHVWLLPNLTEDVGFFASFWPLYKYDYKPGEKNDNNKNSSESSSTNGTDEQQQQQEKDNQGTNGEGNENEDKKAGDSDNSETESEGSQKSQTGKDFEVVDKKELESYNLTS